MNFNNVKNNIDANFGYANAYNYNVNKSATNNSSIKRFKCQNGLENPGGLQFYSYYYPTQSGRFFNRNTPGWRNYQKTGSYDLWW
jgi:hypothetical protein